MKLIRLTIIILIFSSYISSSAEINNEIKIFYEKVFEEEKNNLLQCISDEGLHPENKIHTKCKISKSMRDASYMIHNKRNIDIIDFLPEFKKYKAIKKQHPKYPMNMQYRGQGGYVIVSFDLNEQGKVENPVAEKGFCGNMYNPMTTYEACSFFNNAAVNAIRKFEYMPSQYKGINIRQDNLKHRFSFIMGDTEKIELKNSASAYNNLIRAIKKDDLGKALEIANKNIKSNNYFIYQKAAIKYKQQKYDESVKLFYEFLNKITEDKHSVNENFYVSSFSMLISSLFNLGSFEEIIELEKNYLEYTHNRNKISTSSPITDFYIGASYANLGNFKKGIFYITKAQKNISSEAEYAYIDSVIKQIVNYL